MSSKTKKYRPMFHQQEIAFCGFSGSGKTTLIEKIFNQLSDQYSIGFIKHDAHKFEMDKPGKDTYRMKEAGASQVLISSPEKSALQSNGELNFFNQKQIFLDNDFVIIEGYKNGLQNKLIFLDDDLKILENRDEKYLNSIIALIGKNKSRPKSQKLDKLNKLPYFSRDDILNLCTFITQSIKQKIAIQPIYGLVLSGGLSSRMKQDKALLQYHGKTQLEHSCELLKSKVDKVFISCRENQRDTEQTLLIPAIHDKYIGLGPIGGILSAMDTHPEAAWLIVACDLPFLDNKTLDQLILQRDNLKLATCFTSSSDSLPEPLCTIYEPKSKQRLFEALGQGYRCPRKILINSNVKNIILENEKALDNINYPEEYVSAQKALENGVKNGSI